MNTMKREEGKNPIVEKFVKKKKSNQPPPWSFRRVFSIQGFPFEQFPRYLEALHRNKPNSPPF